LRSGVTLLELQQLARALTDVQAAEELNEARLVRISAIVDGCFSLIVHGETASARMRWSGAQAPGWNVAQSSTISLKRAVEGLELAAVLG
jgi:hypothetical protein